MLNAERGETYRIRLRFSSIVNYLAIIYRMLVAIGFTVIVARRLSIEEFGFWGVILSLTTMFIAPIALWSFWTTRYLSRGIKLSFGTGLTLTLIYDLLVTPPYLITAYSLGTLIIKSALQYSLLSLPYLWLNTIYAYSAHILTVVKPEVIGFRGFIYETSRLVLAYVLVAYLGMRLGGAIMSLVISLLISNAYAFSILKHVNVFELGFSHVLVKEWFKGFSIPILNTIYSFLISGVRAFTSTISGSGVPVAYLNVGLSAQTPMISASSSATPALYARILMGGGGRDVEEVFRIFLLISTLLLSLFITIPRTIASVFNPKYVDAWVVIVVLSVYAYLEGIRAVLSTVIVGSSRVDVNGIKNVKQVINSGLFRAPLVRVVGLTISYIIGATLLISFWSNYLMQATAIALALLIGAVITMPWFIINALRSIKFKLPLREVCTATISGFTVATYLLLTNVNEVIVKSFWTDMPLLATHLLAVLGIYIFLWYTLSPWFRRLTRESLRYVLRTLQFEAD